MDRDVIGNRVFWWALVLSIVLAFVCSLHAQVVPGQQPAAQQPAAQSPPPAPAQAAQPATVPQPGPPPRTLSDVYRKFYGQPQYPMVFSFNECRIDKSTVDPGRSPLVQGVMILVTRERYAVDFDLKTGQPTIRQIPVDPTGEVAGLGFSDPACAHGDTYGKLDPLPSPNAQPKPAAPASAAPTDKKGK